MCFGARSAYFCEFLSHCGISSPRRWHPGRHMWCLWSPWPQRSRIPQTSSHLLAGGTGGSSSGKGRGGATLVGRGYGSHTCWQGVRGGSPLARVGGEAPRLVAKGRRWPALGGFHGDDRCASVQGVRGVCGATAGTATTVQGVRGVCGAAAGTADTAT